MSMPLLAKEYVLQLIFLTDPVPATLIPHPFPFPTHSPFWPPSHPQVPPSSGQAYVLRLLFLTEPVPAALILHRFPSCATSLPSCLVTNPFRPALTHRSLPPLAKMYVLRLLFLTDPVPATLVADWPKPEAHSKHKAALDRLQQLHLLLLCR
ncbi:unnamed protein product [Closterium sp. NIES-53]